MAFYYQSESQEIQTTWKKTALQNTSQNDLKSVNHEGN